MTCENPQEPTYNEPKKKIESGSSGSVLQYASDTDTSEDDELGLMPKEITGSTVDHNNDSGAHDSTTSPCQYFFIDYVYKPRFQVGNKHMHELSYLLDFRQEHQKMLSGEVNLQ